MAEEGAPYRGFLYCGLMITHDGPKVIEFNVRFGDPEAQVVLPLLDEPLAPMLMAAAAGQLRSRAPHTVAAHSTLSAPRTAHLADRTAHPALRTTHENCAVGVVLAAAGYPGDVRPGDRLEGLDTLARECPDALVFFAGVKARDGGLVTSGGRVMTIVSRGATFERAIARAYDAVSRVSFAGMQFRRDIGRKALTSLDQQRS
jgi:phosphoribosylamine--glycine ligase